jgi:hypothetical protein
MFTGVRHVGLERQPPPGVTAICLYKAWRDVLGDYPAYVSQEIGDCVGMGHGRANDLLQCIEISLGADLQYRETDTEFIYAVSRQVVGILSDDDGSYGAAAAMAMTTCGMLDREMLGSDGTYSGKRSKDWGKLGAPPHYFMQAAGFKLGDAAKVESWDDLVAAISNGYPVTICTQSGFADERDADGFCAVEGKWGHCMFIAGVRFDRPGACIIQSWGPDEPTGPLSLDQPTYSFWAERAAVEGILAEGDSWALSRTPAFIRRGVSASTVASALAQ